MKECDHGLTRGGGKTFWRYHLSMGTASEVKMFYKVIILMRLDWHNDPVTWYKRKLCSGASKAKQLVPVQLDIPLFWKSDYETCVPSLADFEPCDWLCLLKESVTYLKSNIVNCRGIVFKDSINI